MDRTIPPQEYIDALKKEFTEQSDGYKPNESTGYFAEWLIIRLYKLQKLNENLTERVAKQSELLSKKAEK